MTLLPTEEEGGVCIAHKEKNISRNVGPRKDGANLWSDLSIDVEYDYENGPLEAEEVAAVVADAVGEFVDGGSPCCDGGSTTDASEEDASFLDDLFFGIDLETEFGSSDVAPSVLGIDEGEDEREDGGHTDGEDESGVDEVCCSVVGDSCEKNGLKHAAAFWEAEADEEQEAKLDQVQEQEGGDSPAPSSTAALLDITALDPDNADTAVSLPPIAATTASVDAEACPEQHDTDLPTSPLFADRAAESCVPSIIASAEAISTPAKHQTSHDTPTYTETPDADAGNAADVATPDAESIQDAVLAISDDCGELTVVDDSCATADASGVADDGTAIANFDAVQDGGALVVSLGGDGISDADIDADHATVGSADIIPAAAMAAGVSTHLLNAVDLWESANAEAKSSRRARRAARGGGQATTARPANKNATKKKKNEFGKRRRSSGGGDGKGAAAGARASLQAEVGRGKVKADPLVALKDKRLLSKKPLIVQWLRSDGCQADAEAESAIGKAVDSLDSIHTHYWGGGG